MKDIIIIFKHRLLEAKFYIFAFIIMGFIWVPFDTISARTPGSQTLEVQAPLAATCVDFSSITAGDSVEGLGTVVPMLNISTSSGQAVAISEGITPSAYGAPNDQLLINNGVGALAGFFDQSRLHDYSFTFAPDVSVKYFSVTMLDFGDFNAIGATEHSVSLNAYDDSGLATSDTLSFTSDGQVIPRSGSAGDLFFTGDAVSAEPGQPGRFTFEIFDNNITRLEMNYSSDVNDTQASDPYFALAILCFEIEEEPPQPPSGTVCADFGTIEPGFSVEGLGTVHPLLNISTSTNDAVAIAETLTPSAFGAPNDALILNNGVGDLAGFFDKSRIHDYSFTFAPDTFVDYFAVTMLDFGDFNQNGATEHSVTLLAYDINNDLVATDTLAFTSDGMTIPRSGSAGDLFFTGDAITAVEGEPGRFTFIASAENIVRLEIEFSSNVDNQPTDPFFALAVLCFDPQDSSPELDPPTAVLDLLRPKTGAVGGKYLVEYACSETAPNLVSATINGYDVTSGQNVNLIVSDNESARIVNDVLIWLFAPEFSLDVTCSDGNGNEVSTSVAPVFETP